MQGPKQTFALHCYSSHFSEARSTVSSDGGLDKADVKWKGNVLHINFSLRAELKTCVSLCRIFRSHYFDAIATPDLVSKAINVLSTNGLSHKADCVAERLIANESML